MPRARRRSRIFSIFRTSQFSSRGREAGEIRESSNWRSGNGTPCRIVLLGGLVIKRQTRRGTLDDRANVRFVRFLIRANRIIRRIAIFSRRETKIRWKMELITAFGLVLILRHFRKRRPSILWFPASSTLVQRLVSESRIRRNWSESVFSVCYNCYRLGEFLFRESMIIFIRFFPGLSSMNNIDRYKKKEKERNTKYRDTNIPFSFSKKVLAFRDPSVSFSQLRCPWKKGLILLPPTPWKRGRSRQRAVPSFLITGPTIDERISVGKKVARGEKRRLPGNFRIDPLMNQLL